MKPLIGITGREFAYGTVEGSLPILGDAMVDAVMASYVDAVLESGGVPVHLPLRVDPAELVDRIDGLVLTGGADIEPGRYGASPEPEVTIVEPERDEFELQLTKLALAHTLPTLAICRGHQVLNVASGGTLRQHVPAHNIVDTSPTTRVHDVSIEPGTLLHRLYGPTLAVNSLHHQGVGELGRDLRISAIADDGMVEAIEVDGKPIVGIQWHPEMYHEREPIFDWLIEASATR